SWFQKQLSMERNYCLHSAESVVNRWFVDHLLFLAIDLLEKKQFNDFFCAIRKGLDYVLCRPLEATETTPTKIRVLQFLIWINEGERLGEQEHFVTVGLLPGYLFCPFRFQIAIPKSFIFGYHRFRWRAGVL
uniref:Uncharacterized protein n=1 Tax=Periophthalmus magnuspinnatus TaxID=409849 RepID=A0A3B3ZT66_9GOBI